MKLVRGLANQRYSGYGYLGISINFPFIFWVGELGFLDAL